MDPKDLAVKSAEERRHEARSLVLDLQVAEESLVAAEIAAEAANRNVTQATANLRRIRSRIEASLAAGEVLP